MVLKTITRSQASFSDHSLLQYLCDRGQKLIEQNKEILSFDFQCGCSSALFSRNRVGLSLIPVGRTMESGSVGRLLYDDSSEGHYSRDSALVFVVDRNFTKYTEAVEDHVLPCANAMHAAGVRVVGLATALSSSVTIWTGCATS